MVVWLFVKFQRSYFFFYIYLLPLPHGCKCNPASPPASPPLSLPWLLFFSLFLYYPRQMWPQRPCTQEPKLIRLRTGSMKAGVRGEGWWVKNRVMRSKSTVEKDLGKEAEFQSSISGRRNNQNWGSKNQAINKQRDVFETLIWWVDCSGWKQTPLPG